MARPFIVGKGRNLYNDARSLFRVAQALTLDEEISKTKEGQELIRALTRYSSWLQEKHHERAFPPLPPKKKPKKAALDTAGHGDQAQARSGQAKDQSERSD